MALLRALERAISQATGQDFQLEHQHSIAGGCINRSEQLIGGGQRYFAKFNHADRIAMFEAEAAGLGEIERSQSVTVPHVVCSGIEGDQAYFVLEYLEMTGVNSQSEERLGRQLAAMHRCTQAQYGWNRDNTIGSTPQINTPQSDWVDFYREQRLRFQFELAAENGYSGKLQRQADVLLEKLPEYFADYSPAASLLHGDLWGGNHSALSDGQPVIFDPAVYYGDREADLAMTELFGGFGARFYAAYREAWPLDPGYRVRKDLYNLYHVLNHLNLFGGGYLAQAEGLCAKLLAA